MRVICIDDRPGIETGETPPFKSGDILNAMQSVTYKDCYNISEHLFSEDGKSLKSWLKSRFIPLSSIDETEFERNYNKELV